MPRATVTSKGQITIPRSIRRALRLQAGDRLDFVLEAKDRLVVRPAAPDLGDLKGLLHRPRRRPVTLDEMEAAIARQGRRR